MPVKPFTEKDRVAEMQRGDGRSGQFEEIGTSGIQAFAGYIQQAYHAELRWPAVFPLFDRLRRSDPEIAIVRQIFNSLGRSVNLVWQLPDEPSDDDKKFQEFGEEVFDDIEGGIGRFRDAILSYVPFHGWGWWELVPGLRKSGWRPPNRDEWRSKYDDGRIGVRRLAWRDQSSFNSWEMDDDTGRLQGMNQLDLPNPPTLIPVERSVHLTLGDTESPEGLSPLEAVWRLERVKYALELVQGIGYDHAAGYLNVETDKQQLTDADHTAIRKAARAVMTVQEGNYVAWPKGLTGELKDVNFSAAATLLESIRYYGILKLQVYAMSWIAMASTAKTGAFSAVQDVSALFIKIFNSMNEGFAEQIDRQLGQRLYDWNKESFPGLTERPIIVCTTIDKQVALAELGSFMKEFASMFPIDDDDIIAFRRHSGILKEAIPEEDALTIPEEPEGEGEEEIPEEEGEEPGEGEEEEAEEDIEEGKKGEMALRPFKVSDKEYPTDVTHMAIVTQKDVDDAVRHFQKYAKEHEPDLYKWLTAPVKEEEEEKKK